MSQPRNLLDAFDAAAWLAQSAERQEVPPVEAAAENRKDYAAALSTLEGALALNGRALDTATRRLASECTDRLGWIQRLKAAVAEEERAVERKRRVCEDLQRLAAKHRDGMGSLIQQYSRLPRTESLDERELIAEQRIAAVSARTREVEALFLSLDDKEQAAASVTADWRRHEEEVERLLRDAHEEMKAIRVMEYEVSDRRRAAERKQDSITSWEARLDKREQELLRAERSAAATAASSAAATGGVGGRGVVPAAEGTLPSATMRGAAAQSTSNGCVEDIDLDDD